MYASDPDERERQVAKILAAWPTGEPGVIVGGYAVAAYAPPRYSVDVDIVTSHAFHPGWVEWLRSRGFAAGRVHRFSAETDSRPEVQQWQLGRVTLDLMTGGVRDRDSGVTIPVDWILRSPHNVRLELLSGKIERPLPVVRLEALWALKLVAGRPHDLSDLFATSAQPIHLSEIRDLLDRLMTKPLREKLARVSRQLHEERLYVDSLSRLGRGSPNSKPNQDSWNRFGEMVRRAMPQHTAD